MAEKSAEQAVKDIFDKAVRDANLKRRTTIAGTGDPEMVELATILKGVRAALAELGKRIDAK